MLDPADNHCGIGIGEIAGDNADGVGALYAQRAREIVGAIIQFAGCSENSLFGAFGNGAGRGGIIQNRGDRAGE